MASIPELRLSISHLVDDDAEEEYKHAAGQAAKKAAARAAKADLGPDMAMSNFGRRGARGNVALTSGYDLEARRVMVNLRPKGAWILANEGRYKIPASGRYYTGSGRGRNRRVGAFETPWGWRRWIKASRSRPLGTLEDAEELMEVEVPEAVDLAITKRILREF